MRMRKCISALLMCILLPGFYTGTHAQGWSFTMSLSQSGPCGATLPYILPVTIPYMPTQSYCESIRQTILAIRSSMPVYNNQHQYIGECAVFYTCSACTGSDMVMPASSVIDPGEVSINGLTEGMAFFSPHESEAIERWMNDYKQKMASLGVPVDNWQPSANPDIPSTGDADFDGYYANQVVRYEKPEQGGIVDLSGKKGIVVPDGAEPEIPATPEPVAAEPTPAGLSDGSVALFRDPNEGYIDEFYRTHFSPICPDNGLYGCYTGNLEESPFWTTDQMIELTKAAVGIPLGFIEGAAGYAVIPVVNLLFEDYKAGVQLYQLMNGENVTVPSFGNIMVNTAKASTIDLLAKGVDEFAIGKVVGNQYGSAAQELYGKSPGVAGTVVTAWGLNDVSKKK